MWTSSALLALCSILAQPAVQALAQLPPIPSWSRPGPWWWGEGYGWPLWWICPVMMLAMLVVMGAMMLARRGGAGKGN